MPKKELFEVFNRQGIPIKDGKHPSSLPPKEEEQASEVVSQPEPVEQSPAEVPEPTTVETPVQETVAQKAVEVAPPVMSQPQQEEIPKVENRAPAPVASEPSSNNASSQPKEGNVLVVRHDTGIIALILILLVIFFAYLLGLRNGQNSPVLDDLEELSSSPYDVLKVAEEEKSVIQRPPTPAIKVTKPPVKPPSNTPPKGAYTLQILTYGNSSKKWKTQSDLMVKKLKSLGLDAYRRTLTSGKIVLYVGNYKSRTDSRIKSDKGKLAKVKIGSSYPFRKPFLSQVK